MLPEFTLFWFLAGLIVGILIAVGVVVGIIFILVWQASSAKVNALYDSLPLAEFPHRRLQEMGETYDKKG